jgi:hypothetical protein
MDAVSARENKKIHIIITAEWSFTASALVISSMLMRKLEVVRGHIHWIFKIVAAKQQLYNEYKHNDWNVIFLQK